MTSEQTETVKAILSGQSKSFLLHGETGTGKTRVYLELAKSSLENNRSVMMLTPEIGLTQPLLNVFQQQFGDRVIVTHSAMTPAERRIAWVRIARSNHPLVIIGPRSALFNPVSNLGLIIVDEAHDTAYKQEQAPRYQTTRVAAELARIHDATLVMGTATPLVSDYFVFREKGLPILRMLDPATGKDHRTKHYLVDQRDRSQFSRSPWLSNPLLDAIERSLRSKEQSMLFLNRRGSARLVVCESCGWQAMCPHCDVPLTFHADQHLMRCHSCDFAGQPPLKCTSCGHHELLFKSIGTKALEIELRKIFPEALIARFDSDTERAERLHLQHDKLQKGDIDIIVGTQAVVKGFDLPYLSVVGVISGDSGLQIPDYTATERSFQLISQVSGRIGRGHRAGHLFIQTYHPNSQLLEQALNKDYLGFLESELRQREIFNFPPYYFMATVTCSRATSKAAKEACEKIAKSIRTTHSKVLIEGPSPRFIEKTANKYSWHLILKARQRSHLTELVKVLPSHAIYDLDPSNLL